MGDPAATGTVFQLAAALGAVGSRDVTLPDLAQRLPLPPALVGALVGRLIGLGLVEREPSGVLSMTADGRTFLIEGELHARPALGASAGARKPLDDTLRQRAWTAMRLAGRFTIGSIAVLARRHDDANPEDNLRRYVAALVRAGYVAQLPTRAGPPEAGAAAPRQYRLVRDSGPAAPVLRRRGRTMFDPNLGAHVDVATEAGDG